MNAQGSTIRRPQAYGLPGSDLHDMHNPVGYRPLSEWSGADCLHAAASRHIDKPRGRCHSQEHWVWAVYIVNDDYVHVCYGKSTEEAVRRRSG